MMKKYFKGLFKYNHWANMRVLIALEKGDIKDDKALSLFSHLLSAETVWWLRIRGLPTAPFPLWEQYSINELKTMTEETGAKWKEYLKNHKFETFEEMIFYQDSSGKKRETVIREIITQVVTHSAYHRGQISQRLRELEMTPPEIDYIHFQRQTL